MDREKYDVVSKKLQEVDNNYFILYEELKDVEYTPTEHKIYSLGFLKGYIEGLRDAGINIHGGLDGHFRVIP